MAYEKKTWKNRQSEHPNRRTLTPVDGQENIYDVTRAEGLIMEEGDAFDQEEMNNLEERISNSFSELSSVTVTLPSSGWQGSQAPYTQTVTVEGMTGDWKAGQPAAVPEEDQTLDQKILIREALGYISQIQSGEGSLTVTCYEEKPETNLTIRIPGVM